MSATVENLDAVSVILPSTASGDPSDRRSVATGVPACCATVCSPMRLAIPGSPV